MNKPAVESERMVRLVVMVPFFGKGHQVKGMVRRLEELVKLHWPRGRVELADNPSSFNHNLTTTMVAQVFYGSSAATNGSTPCQGTAWVVTKYPDGTEVHAHPNHRPEDYRRATELGYHDGDVEAMTLDHDPLHMRLCVALGLRRSPTLWAIAHDQPPSQVVTDTEEAMVLAAQRFLQVMRNQAVLPPGWDGDE